MRVGSVFDIDLKKILLVASICLFAVMPVQAEMEDPTRPPTAKSKVYTAPKKVKRPGWVLTSTLVSAGRRTAVINDRVVARGDRINGARVTSIQPSAVRLKKNGREIILTMLKKKIKKLSQVRTVGQGK